MNKNEPDLNEKTTNPATSMKEVSGLRLANAIADPVVVFSRNFEVVHLNQPAKDAFSNVTIGGDIRVMFRAPQMVNLLTEAVRGGATASADLAERVPLERFYHVTASLIDAQSGLHVLLFKDQTEARRIDRMRSDFIANASHELRTPLTSISGFIETLRGSARNDPASHDQFLDIMQQQTARMSRLIADLLSLSRVEMKKDIKPEQEVDLTSVVDTVVETLSSLAIEKGFKFERISEDDEYLVRGDRDELVQVFQNLIENAINYGKPGNQIRIGIEKRDMSGTAVIDAYVQDFGRGIPKEHISRITERFYRVEPDGNNKGTGLGLSIVKHILARHGAALTVNSAAGKGSKFSVMFTGLPTG